MLAEKLSEYLKNKDDEKSEPDSDDGREAFDAFADALKSGDKDDAFDAFKAAVHECMHEDKGGGMGVMIAIGKKR